MDPITIEPECPEQILEQQVESFIDEEPIRMFDDSTILKPIRSMLPSFPNGPVQNVSIGRVSTYIYRTEMSKADGHRRVVFPTFASHWAVIVCEPHSPTEYGHVYHLTFHDVDAARFNPPADVTREVQFSTMTLKQTPEGMKEIGTTRYGHSDRMRIGDAMIKAFGSYHRVFWNCQHFARLYLSVITDGVGKFDEWTLSQTSNLFLCAFVVTIPIATTNKTIETKKAREIIARYPSTSTAVNEQIILDASNEAITLAEELAIADYARNQPNDVRVERRGPLKHMLKVFNEIVERGVGWVAGKRKTRQG
jgi:hypothetical protein